MQQENSNIELTFHAVVFNQALLLIEDKVIKLREKSLETFRLPKTTRETIDVPQEILRETTYDVVELREFLQENETKLLPEQQTAFKTILCSVRDDAGQVFILDAPGGTGKTFLIRLLLARICSEGVITLAVASSGIAATLLPGGRTAHSAFKLPLDLGKVETVNCNIAMGSAPVKLLQRTILIIWDECTMARRAGVEALDRTLRDLRGKNTVMGGVTLLLSGDFHQTLPVIPRGTKADELGASLRASPIWNNIQQLHLTVNMRVYLHGIEETGQFANDLLRLGNGQIPHVDGKGSIELPFGQSVNSLHDLQTTVFPGLQHRFPDRKWLAERAISAPKNDAVDTVNRCLTDRMPEESKVNFSRDSTDEDQAVHYPVEFLNSLNPAGLPPHKLTLKLGVLIMLLRNLDPPKLCNGTRLHPNVLEATIITGHYEGEEVFIPRIPLIPTDLPFEFRRLQFPIMVCFAMSINKSQGQTLQVIGLNLESPCFSHGQLYVACSRVGHPSSLIIYTPGGKTSNIEHKEILTYS